MNVAVSSYSNIRIETPENIAFHYELAGPGTRMVAYLFDFLIIIVMLFAIGGVGGWIMAEMGTDGDVLVAMAIALISIVWMLSGYFILFESILNGQTPGKRLLRIRVLQDNGTPVEFTSILLRNLFRVVDCQFPFQFAIGTLSLIFSKETQRFGDHVAGTIVVKEGKTKKASSFVYKERPVFTGFKQELYVERDEFNFLMEYISVYKKLRPADRNRISRKIIRPLIVRNNLQLHPQLAGVVASALDKNNILSYKSSEEIMKEVLRHYRKQEGDPEFIT